MKEMEISRAQAEYKLQEHGGNVVEAIIALTNWFKFYNNVLTFSLNKFVFQFKIVKKFNC